MEEIQRLKCELESDVSTPDTILSALKLLGSKNLSKDVLMSTKIGHTVNQLRRQGSNEEIREQAKLVFRRWRGFIRDSEKEKPLIEVHCDKKTEVLRGKARQFLADALQVTVCTFTIVWFQKISTLPPWKVFVLHPLPPGNSSLASYFASKILASKTPSP